MTNTDWGKEAGEKRKVLAYIAAKQLDIVQELLSEIIATYPDEGVSAAHPKSGVQQMLKRALALQKEMRSIR